MPTEKTIQYNQMINIEIVLRKDWPTDLLLFLLGKVIFSVSTKISLTCM